MSKLISLSLLCLLALDAAAFGQMMVERGSVAADKSGAIARDVPPRLGLPAPAAGSDPVQGEMTIRDTMVTTATSRPQLDDPPPLARLGLPIAEQSDTKPAPATTEKRPARSDKAPELLPAGFTNMLGLMLPGPQDGLPRSAIAPAVSAPQGKPPMIWGSGEFVFWWLQGSQLPPLVTASPAGTPQTRAGDLGAPGTQILVGDARFNVQMRPGGRFTLGAWLDEERTWGVEGNFMMVGSQSFRAVAGSDGSQIIARPFIDATTGREAAELVAFPGVVSGSAAVTARSDPLYSADALLRANLCADCWRRLDMLVGYRYVHFSESLQVQENLTLLESASRGTTFLINDAFATRNEFNGGEVGLQAEFVRDAFSLQLLGKLAIGNMYRQVAIGGNTLITPAGVAPLAYQGGLLALSGNSGIFTSNRLAWVPELGFNGGWQITPRVRATVGYSLLWLTDIVRPADQIDRTVNPNLVPPPSPGVPVRPIFVLHDSDLWLQGVRLGLEFRF